MRPLSAFNDDQDLRDKEVVGATEADVSNIKERYI